MNFDYDHDRFVAKNRMLAGADEIDRRDKKLESKGFSRLKREQEASCFNCKFKGKCADFRAKRSGGTKGAVSFGGDNDGTMLCDRYEPAPVKSRNMSDRQIKSLMKNFKRSR